MTSRPRLPGILTLALLLLFAAPVNAQYAISIGATIAPTVGEESVQVEIGLTASGVEVQTRSGAVQSAVLRSTNVTRPGAEPVPDRTHLLGVPQRTDVARDAAAVKAALSAKVGSVRLVHTTVLVIDA